MREKETETGNKSANSQQKCPFVFGSRYSGELPLLSYEKSAVKEK